MISETDERHLRVKISSLSELQQRPKKFAKRSEICDAIFSGGDWHFTASDIHNCLKERGHQVSLATVYNTLHCFSKKGLIRRLPKCGQIIYFDTCTTEHAHIYDEDRGELRDAPGNINLALLLSMPDVSDVVIFRPAGSEPMHQDEESNGCCCG